MDTSVNVPLQKTADDLSGIKGWLAFFIFMLFSNGFYFLYFALERFFSLKFDIPDIFYITILAAAGVIPLYLLNQLYARRKNIINLTRIYLIVFPAIWVIWDLYKADYNFTRHSVLSILFSLLLNIATFSLPWYLYLSKSKRVKNTFTIVRN